MEEIRITNVLKDVSETVSSLCSVDWIVASVDVSAYGLKVFACSTRGISEAAAEYQVGLAVDNLIAGCKPHWIRYKGKVAVCDHAKEMIEALVGPSFQDVSVVRTDACADSSKDALTAHGAESER